MLQNMKLNHTYVAKVVATTTYVQNQIPTKAISTITLKEVCCEYKLSINHLRVFDCVTFVHVPKEARTKFDSKGVKCIFIRYCEESKGYKFDNLINQYVIINHDVIFDESRNFNGEIMVSRLDSRLK
jgi:hypothetical protein